MRHIHTYICFRNDAVEIESIVVYMVSMCSLFVCVLFFSLSPSLSRSLRRGRRDIVSVVVADNVSDTTTIVAATLQTFTNTNTSTAAAASVLLIHYLLL